MADNMQDDSPEDRLKAKLQALRSLKASNFYDQKMDNPENLDLESGQPQVQEQPTMQGNPGNLLDALRRKNQDEQLKGLFPQNNDQ